MRQDAAFTIVKTASPPFKENHAARRRIYHKTRTAEPRPNHNDRILNNSWALRK